MSETRTPRRTLAARLGLPAGFLQFDMKDTFRLVVWIVVAAFSLGGLWAQNKATQTSFNDRMEREERARTELATQIKAVTDDVAKRQNLEATQVAALEGIRTELRYVNEKIDVLRSDVRASRHPE